MDEAEYDSLGVLSLGQNTSGTSNQQHKRWILAMMHFSQNKPLCSLL